MNPTTNHRTSVSIASTKAQKSGYPTLKDRQARTPQQGSLDLSRYYQQALDVLVSELARENHHHQRKHKEFLYAQAAKVAAIASRLNGEAEWRSFCQQEDWQEYLEECRPKSKDRKRSTYFVYIRIYGDSENGKATAHERYQAVDYLLSHEGVAPESIASEIKRRGGFAGVDEERPKKQVHKRKEQKSDLKISLQTEKAKKKLGNPHAVGSIMVRFSRGAEKLAEFQLAKNEKLLAALIKFFGYVSRGAARIQQ